jgi:tuberculosinol/isotuberculosinol synthase
MTQERTMALPRMSMLKFLDLPTHEVSLLVRKSGHKVAVFPVNGTRRWFMLEHGALQFEDPIAAYTDIVIKRHIELYRLFFDHGITTLVTPVIGAEVLDTRDDYMQKIGAEGLASLATRADFLEFYEEYGVRVRFYGDYRNALRRTPYEGIISLYDELTYTTRANDRFRLFFGVFADEQKADEFMIGYTADYYRDQKEAPSRRAVVEAYYGEYLEKADFFIGFDRLSVFDYPFLNWGGEDLYFTVAPSLYMTDLQLRLILYDHLYSRRIDEPDYLALDPPALERLRNFYDANNLTILGVGKPGSRIWLPETQNIRLQEDGT